MAAHFSLQKISIDVSQTRDIFCEIEKVLEWRTLFRKLCRCSDELATKVYVVIVRIKLISRETPKYTYQSCDQRIFSECVCIVVVSTLLGSSVSERSCYSKQVISEYSKRLIAIALD